MHACIHTYVHTYKHTYTRPRTCNHTHLCFPFFLSLLLCFFFAFQSRWYNPKVPGLFSLYFFFSFNNSDVHRNSMYVRASVCICIYLCTYVCTWESVCVYVCGSNDTDFLFFIFFLSNHTLRVLKVTRSLKISPSHFKLSPAWIVFFCLRVIKSFCFFFICLSFICARHHSLRLELRYVLIFHVLQLLLLLSFAISLHIRRPKREVVPKELHN